jgi:hypothetical protein
MMPPATLAGYSDEDIRAFYGRAIETGDAHWLAVLTEEAERRDAVDRQAREPGPGSRPALRAEWERMAHAQWLDAERQCAGELLNDRGRREGIDPFTLWSGPLHRAEIYASEELRNYWLACPRIDVGTYLRQAAGEQRAWQDRHDRALCAEHQRKGAAMSGTGEITGQQEPGRTERREALRARAAEIRGERARSETLSADLDAGQLAPVPAAYKRPETAVAVREGTIVQAGRQWIDGDKTLRYIYTFLKHFAHWGSEAELIAATLWVAQTHARDGKGYPVWQYCARLAIIGPSGSGKSWKSRLVGKLAYSGEILVEMTKPSFIDFCAENHTIVITEADEAFRSPGRSRGIVAVANASYEPDRKSSRKQGGVAVKIPVFCHLVLDGIEEVLLSPNRPDLRALMSRCILVMSREAPAGYRPPRFDARARAVAADVGKRATAWMAQEVADGMADDVPVVPEHLGNRPFALWEPLFIVALRADGGDPDGPWSTACREACEQLEAAAGVPDQSEDQESELDRQMAEMGMDW